MKILSWLPNRVLKTRTSNDYPKRFYFSLIYEFNSRFIEEEEMEKAMEIGKDRDALTELISLGLIVVHLKKDRSGRYYELTDFFNGVYEK